MRRLTLASFAHAPDPDNDARRDFGGDRLVRDLRQAQSEKANPECIDRDDEMERLAEHARAAKHARERADRERYEAALAVREIVPETVDCWLARTPRRRRTTETVASLLFVALVAYCLAWWMSDGRAIVHRNDRRERAPEISTYVQ